MNYADHRPIIDAHIHLDQYNKRDQKSIIDSIGQPFSELHGVIAVSMDYASSKQNLKLAETYLGVHPSFGYHPEQKLPSDRELSKLFSFIQTNLEKMVAIGEVGLPYYLRRENRAIQLEPYIELLETFIRFAKEQDKPIVLHAIYEDADIVCDLLEKHSIQQAHFHWFKGSSLTAERMSQNGYYISVTPDCVYEEEIQTLILQYPIGNLMIETDGPWPFTGPFENKLTHPHMMHHSIKTIASLKNIKISEVYRLIYDNTKRFFHI